MAIGELQLIRSEILRLSACSCSNASAYASPRVLQQTERHQCWAASSSLAESCQELWSDVKFVQLRSQDKVFARQLTAYKLMAICDAQGLNLVSAVDGISRFQLGRKSVSSYGFLIATNAEAAVHAPTNSMLTKRSVPMAVVRVIVSGRGVRLGSDYIFPEMTPVAIAYLWQ
ncbi:hypothetical protein WJX82_006554 [Trebouxia sp. C0006]